MNELTDLLHRLAQAAPDVCEKVAETEVEIIYKIGGYVFFFADGEFSAGHKDHIGRTQYYTGSPALDWLQGAVRAAIEARGLDYETRYIAPIGNIGPRHKVTIFNGKESHIADDPAAALLAAFVAAVEVS